MENKRITDDVLFEADLVSLYKTAQIINGVAKMKI